MMVPLVTAGALMDTHLDGCQPSAPYPCLGTTDLPTVQEKQAHPWDLRSDDQSVRGRSGV